MLVVFLVSLISILFAYLASHYSRYQRTLLKISFALITVLQMIHYDYGNDYMAYLNDHMLYNVEWSEILHLWKIRHGAFKDLGWVIIQRAFPGEKGFFVFVAIISVVQSCVFYYLIRDYVEEKNHWKGFAIYVLSSNLYVLSFSAMRQGLAVSLCVFAFLLAFKKKYLRAVLVVLFATSIHSSAIVILPFLLLTKVKLKNGKAISIMFLAAAAVLYISTAMISSAYSVIMEYLPFLARNYGHYIETMSGSKASLGLGWLLNTVMYIIVLWFIYKRFDDFSMEHRCLLFLVCIAFLITPFSLYISGIVSRLQTYFSVFEIVVVPLVYSKIKDKILRIGVKTVYIFMMLYTYYLFFFVTEWSSVSYSTFKTIFSTIK